MTEEIEQRFRAGFAELVAKKPALGPIRLPESGGRPRTRWWAVAAVLVLVAGVGLAAWFGVMGGRPTIADPATPTDPLAGTRWLAVDVGGTRVTPDADGHSPSLVFGTDGTVSGSDPCNRFSGRYQIEGNRLELTDLAVSERACGSDLVGQQRSYLRLLKSTASMDVDQSTLLVIGPQTECGPDCISGRGILFKQFADLPSTDQILIRVRNQSGIDLRDIRLGFAHGGVEMGSVATGSTTDYQPVAEAYTYAAVRAYQSDGKKLDRPVVDFVGEKSLPPGRYTYVFGPGPGIRLEFEADQ